MHDRTPPRRLTVLVADDEDDALARMVSMIRRADPGAHIIQARDGYDALRQAEIADSRGQPVDLAVLDYVMPHFLGPEVARILTTRGITCHVVTSSPLTEQARAETTSKDALATAIPTWVSSASGAVPVEPRSAEVVESWWPLPGRAHHA